MTIDLATAAEAQRVRAFLEAGSRSANLVRLFDYLLDHSGNARAPKEIEIALSVFGKDSAFDTTQNSMVRVHIYRLRSRLDQFYAGSTGPRLTIPNGEYRIFFDDMSSKSDAARLDNSKSKRAALITFVAIFLLTANVLFWISYFLFSGQSQPSQPLATFLRPAASGKKPPIIVTGGFYMFVQSSNGKDVSRMMMRPSIRSMADLDVYLAKHPESAGQLHDFNIDYLSATTALVIWPLLSGISSVRSDGALPKVMPVAQVTEQMLTSQDIFYVGQIDELSLFRALISTRSSFKFDSLNRIQDRVTGKMFTPNYNELASDQPVDKYDYGYLACFPETSGQKIVILAGLQDVAASQMPRIISAPHQFDKLKGASVDGCGFEALYGVRSLGGLKFESKLLVARRLMSAR